MKEKRTNNRSSIEKRLKKSGECGIVSKISHSRITLTFSRRIYVSVGILQFISGELFIAVRKLRSKANVFFRRAIEAAEAALERHHLRWPYPSVVACVFGIVKIEATPQTVASIQTPRRLWQSRRLHGLDTIGLCLSVYCLLSSIPSSLSARLYAGASAKLVRCRY